jgi:hypothetical protein
MLDWNISGAVVILAAAVLVGMATPAAALPPKGTHPNLKKERCQHTRGCPVGFPKPVCTSWIRFGCCRVWVCPPRRR